MFEKKERKARKELIEKLKPFIGSFQDRYSTVATFSRCEELVKVLAPYLAENEAGNDSALAEMLQAVAFYQFLRSMPHVLLKRAAQLVSDGLEQRDVVDPVEMFLAKHFTEVFVIRYDRQDLNRWEEYVIRVMGKAWEELTNPNKAEEEQDEEESE